MSAVLLALAVAARGAPCAGGDRRTEERPPRAAGAPPSARRTASTEAEGRPPREADGAPGAPGRPEPGGATDVPPAEAHVELFVVEGHGRRFGGIAAVAVEGGAVTLEALSAAGPALFTVRVAGGEAAIDALDPALATWLGRIPFARDLPALYLVDGAVRAEVAGVRVAPRRDGWRVRSGAGPARVVVDGDHRVLRDRLRGYRVDVSPLP